MAEVVFSRENLSFGNDVSGMTMNYGFDSLLNDDHGLTQ